MMHYKNVIFNCDCFAFLQQLAAQQLQPIITTETDQVQLANQNNDLTQDSALADDSLKIEQLEEHVIANSDMIGDDSSSVEVGGGENGIAEGVRHVGVTATEIITSAAPNGHVISFSWCYLKLYCPCQCVKICLNTNYVYNTHFHQLWQQKLTALKS